MEGSGAEKVHNPGGGCGGYRSRIGRFAIEVLDMWLGDENPDCCNGGVEERARRIDGPGVD